MRKYCISFSVVLFLLITCSCGLKEGAKMDAEKVRQEIKDRKIKRYTDLEIFDGAMKHAQLLADSLSPNMNTKVMSCDSLQIPKLPESLASLVASIELHCEVPANFSGKEANIWSAYQYSIENNLPLETNLQKLEDNNYLYTLPVSFGNTDSTKVAFLRMVIERKALILKM